jgi:uncharacterized protein (UPF0261 family)
LSEKKAILIIGTYDTKSDELEYLADRIIEHGARVKTLDVSVLGETDLSIDYSKHEVASAANSTIEKIAALGDENLAMQQMANGASKIVKDLHSTGEIDGMISLGGTMGTDLALDCASALPMGVPKYIISTVAFSPLLSAERLAPDIQMILWAGGLHGLSSICKSSLSQAAGAIVGATTIRRPEPDRRPLIGMTSQGKSCLTYMFNLKPELEKRGFEVAVFHATGMGGRAFESLAAQGAFAAVFDFALSELGNLLNGSVVNAGQARLTCAGNAGIPQLVAPGCIDLIDFPTSQGIPDKFKGRMYHAHNRLVASTTSSPDERRDIAREIGKRLATSRAPAHVILPTRGVETWDRAGQRAHDPEGLAAFIDEMRLCVRPPVELTEVDAHINDPEFCEAALQIFDDWLANGTVLTSVE